MSKLTKYKGYLIDLDGTMYRGTEKIHEAGEFVLRLKAANIPYLFVTNNSSRRPDQVAEKLVSLGVPAEPDQVFTTSMATARYIAEEKPGASYYVIGEEGIKDALQKNGLHYQEEKPDYVVVGIDRDINYEKLAIAALAVRNGAKFISTNGDIAIPTERGLLPGNGSLTSVITVTTEVEPLFIGKPEPIIVNQALEKIGLTKDEAVMVGDNYHTDILAGINAGMDTLHVHTGVTTKEMLTNYDIQPTYSIETLDEWK